MRFNWLANFTGNSQTFHEEFAVWEGSLLKLGHRSDRIPNTEDPGHYERAFVELAQVKRLFLLNPIANMNSKMKNLALTVPSQMIAAKTFTETLSTFHINFAV